MKAGMGWPIGMAVILGLTVAGNIAVMRVASDDPSFAVEPDYYRRAVAYDSTLAQARRNVDLGWAVETRIATVTDGRATRLEITLRGADAAPLAGATVAVTTFFNARASAPLTATLVEETPGRYAATLPIATPGEWETRIDATRGAARFTATARTRVTRVTRGADAP
jgi:nitrogen fixation protein FixH